MSLNLIIHMNYLSGTDRINMVNLRTLKSSSINIDQALSDQRPGNGGGL